MTTENTVATSPVLPKQKLLVLAISRFGMSLILVALILFLPAGTIRFWNAWLFMAALFIPMTLALVYLIKKDPMLLEKRLNLKERQKEQKTYIKISLFLYILAYIIPGLDYRFGWSHVPLWLVIVSTVVMITGYAMFVVVMRQNTFASRVIEIQDKQKVIDTGLYSVVRHPMYLAALVLYLPTPFVLGSWWMTIFISLFLGAIIYRIIHEEKFLRVNLPGYEDYTKRVIYRLIPLVW